MIALYPSLSTDQCGGAKQLPAELQHVVEYLHDIITNLLTLARCLPTLECLGMLVQHKVIHDLGKTTLFSFLIVICSISVLIF